MTEHALADAAIMGARTDAESKLCALVDQWNELRKPLMAPAKEHKRRDIAEHEVRFQIANAAALLAWHLRRPASPTVAAGDVAAAAIRVADATLCQWAPPGDCGRDGEKCLCEAAAKAVLPRPEPAAGDVEAVARGLWDYDLSAGLHKGARQWPEARPDQREYYLGLAVAATTVMAPGQAPDCCPLCGGDCGSANPPITDCPMRPDGQGTGLRPGDVVAHDAHRWKVCGVHYGTVGQESLIELKSLTHEPGWTGEWEHHPRLFVPEVLLRGLTIVRRP